MAKKRGSTKLSKKEKASVFYGEGNWRIRGSKRLGLPPIKVSDGPCGLRTFVEEGSLAEQVSIPAVCYPSPALLACSFDRNLLMEVGGELGRECRANGVDVLLAPAANIKRNPLCGRNFEYYSEDPLLAGEMAASFISGIQEVGVGACLKHFACNSQEFYRMVNDSIVDERALNEIYLKPFEIAVKKSQPWMVMGSYNKINGTYACENKELLEGVLRNQWGFEGIVISDWGATPNYIYSHNAGLDVEMPGNVPRKNELYYAINSGAIERSAHEKSGARIQRVLELNKQGKSKVIKPFNPIRAHDLCVKAVEKSAVLLKNNGILPLKNLNKTCIIGALAESPVICGSGSAKVNPAHLVSFLDAALSRNPNIIYSPGYSLEGPTEASMFVDALDAASKADKVILFLGLPEGKESEGYDREDLQLPIAQKRLFDGLYSTNPNIVVVLNVGGPVELPFNDKAEAILLAYLPGQGGGEGVLRLLLNEACPSGKLAETWPVHLLEVPSFGYFPGSETQSLYRESIYVGYRYYASVKKKDSKKREVPKVAYPFGHGLSYARISYSNLSLEASAISQNETLKGRVEVTNRSKFPADHLVQIYINPEKGNVFKPERYLSFFQKVHLEPETSLVVPFELSFKDFAHYDRQSKSYLVEGGNYEIEIANSSMDIALSKKIKVISEDSFPSLQYSLPAYYNPPAEGFLSFDNDFEALLGHAVALEKDPALRPYTYHSTISDIANTWIGKRLVKEAQARFEEEGNEGNKFLERGMMELPLRALSMQGISQKKIKIILCLANNSPMKAFFTLIFGVGRARKKKKRKAVKKK